MNSKRIVDLALAIPAIFILSPVMIFIAVLLRVAMGPGIFFYQNRPGLCGAPFKIYKFRTMNNRCDENGRLMADGERLTRLGKILRTNSLDELPELFNVLKGDMSLVGPRPLLMQYLDHYTDEQARRHKMRPGITGWAQINGRNAVSWEEKFNLDLWYVNNQSIRLDLKIIAVTIKKALKREGINQPGQITAELFKGSEQNHAK